MRRNLLLVALSRLVLALFCALLLLFISRNVPVVDYFGPGVSPETTWYPLTRFFDNAFILWKVDPILRSLGERFGDQRAGALPAPFLHLAVLALGTFFALRQINPKSFLLSSALLATAAAATIAVVSGIDTVVLSSLLWIPWIIAVLLYAERLQLFSVSLAAITLFLGWRLASAAHQAALPLALIPLAVVAGHLRRRGRVEGAPHAIILTFVLVIPTIFATVNTPAPGLPSYPPTARVVADDGLPGVMRPILGPDIPLQIVDRSVQRERSRALGLLLAAALVGGLIVLLPARAQSRRPLGVSSVLTVLIGALLFDALAPESLAQIGPLATVTRLIPLLILIPLGPIVAALSLLLLALFFVEENDNRATLASLALAALIVCIPSIRSSLTLQSVDPSPWRARALVNAMLSPSAALVRALGPEKFRDASRPLKTHSIRPSEVTVATNPAFNRKTTREGRWSSRRGAQHGDEWIQLSFKESTEASGLVLATGKFPTDYPRGVRIITAPQCERISKEGEIVFEADPWMGPIRFTSEGAPYYGPESDVVIRFLRTSRFGCLKIEQRGRSDHFDWSVTGIRLLQ